MFLTFPISTKCTVQDRLGFLRTKDDGPNQFNAPKAPCYSFLAFLCVFIAYDNCPCNSMISANQSTVSRWIFTLSNSKTGSGRPSPGVQIPAVGIICNQNLQKVGLSVSVHGVLAIRFL